MLWLVGAAVLALMSVACGLTLGARVGKGESDIWKPDVFGWAFGLHGLLGVGAFYMVMQAVR